MSAIQSGAQGGVRFELKEAAVQPWILHERKAVSLVAGSVASGEYGRFSIEEFE